MGAVLVVVCAFVAGAIPFSNIAAHLTRGVDLREVHTGTVSGTSLFKVSGFATLAVAGIFEVTKGAVGPLLAGSDRQVLAALAGGAAVVGHNWSPFLRGKGGRGVSVALGALVVNAWPGTVLLFAALLVGWLCKETAVTVVLAVLALVPLLALTHGADGALAGASVAVPMLVKRLMGNEARAVHRPGVYLRRFLFDRDQRAKT